MTPAPAIRAGCLLCYRQAILSAPQRHRPQPSCRQPYRCLTPILHPFIDHHAATWLRHFPQHNSNLLCCAAWWRFWTHETCFQWLAAQRLHPILCKKHNDAQRCHTSRSPTAPPLLLLPLTSSLGLIPGGSTVPSRVQRPYGKPLIT